MGIGVSIFLIAAGAILAFAVNASISGVNIDVVGWILMGAGVLGLIITLAMFGPRRQRVRQVQQTYGQDGTHTYDERTY